MRFLHCAVAAVLLLSACGEDEDRGVLVGAVIDQSGPAAQPFWREAMELAFEHANEGLAQSELSDSLRFRLRVADSTSTSAVAVDHAQDLKAAGAKALVLDTTESTIAVMKTNFDFEANNDIPLPMICMACTASQLNKPNAIGSNPAEQRALRNDLDLGFRTVAGSDAEAQLLIEYFLEDLPNRGDINGDGQQKLGIATINDIDGQAFLAELNAARDEQWPGMKIESIRHQRGAVVDSHDWYDDLLRLTDDRNETLFGTVDGHPDALLDATYSLYASAITRAYYEAGENVSKIPFFHSHFWHSDVTLINLSGFEIEDSEGISHAIVDNCNTSGSTFVKAFREATRRGPGLFHANAYDAAMSVLLGMVAASERFGVPKEDLSSQQLAEGLRSINDKSDAAVAVYAGPEGFATAVQKLKEGVPIDYVGASGPVDFDENGNVTGNFIKYRIQGREFRGVTTYDCVEDSDSCPARSGTCSF